MRRSCSQTAATPAPTVAPNRQRTFSRSVTSSATPAATAIAATSHQPRPTPASSHSQHTLAAAIMAIPPRRGTCPAWNRCGMSVP